MNPIYEAVFPKVTGDVLISAHDMLFCSEAPPLDVSQAVVVGQVMGRITATGRVIPWNPALANGAEIVYGVALENLTTGASATMPVTCIERGPAVLLDSGLVFIGTVTAPQRLAGIAALLAKQIKVR